MTLSLTVIVPAHNEQEGIPATLAALLAQTEQADEIVVVDDGSTDRTGEVAAAYGVTVLRPPRNLGSKAKAQNHALPHCTTDLVLAVDADTVLAPDYIELIKSAFDDPAVVIAAGNVQTRFARTIWERGRSIEYLFGFHWNRPIQHGAGSPMVCSGCCSAFRRADLVAFGGFPERTIVEDMDYCVPTDHEILTRQGWKTHDRLVVGEDVLALDHARGILTWTPLEAVATFEHDGDLYTFEQDGRSIEFTRNHRWPVVTPAGHREIIPATELRDHQIPLTARYHPAQGGGGLSPRLAAIVGWLVGSGRPLASATLVATGAPDDLAALTGTDAGPPETSGVRVVPIQAADRAEIVGHLRTEEDLPGVVGQLSAEAATAMFDAVIKAGGRVDGSGGLSIAQRSVPVRDALQMLALMAGRNSVARSHSLGIRREGERLVAADVLGRRRHRGRIWCPKTTYGTWVTRHDGVVMPTGNTWSQQIAGHKAVYVGAAVAWAADPETLTYLRKQVWRWMAGFCQNVRLHARELTGRKPMLALWIVLALAEIVTAPLWWTTPFVFTLVLHRPLAPTLAWWFGGELLLTVPPLIYAAHRRRLNVVRVLLNIPFVYATKAVNVYYAWKALIVELILVPLHISQGLTTYEKGRAHTPEPHETPPRELDTTPS